MDELKRPIPVRNLAYREFIVKASGSPIRGQVWEMSDGSTWLFAEQNWYPLANTDAYEPYV